MITTTTPNIERKEIYEYLGIVAGQAVMAAANIYRDFHADGGFGVYEDKLIEIRETALRELEQHATQRGANAIVGVDIDYEVLGKTNGMLMVTVSGTAVKIR